MMENLYIKLRWYYEGALNWETGYVVKEILIFNDRVFMNFWSRIIDFWFVLLCLNIIFVIESEFNVLNKI